MKKRRWIASIIISAALIYFLILTIMNKPRDEAAAALPLQVTSSEFSAGAPIPTRFTCDGNDASPPLGIAGIPREATTLTLIMDDPDSPTGTWDHWVVFDIPTQNESVRSIPAGEEPRGVQGRNSWGRLGYGGPCPGKGEHRYFLKVYALDDELALPEGSTKKEIETAMAGHVLAYGELMGRYERGR